MVVMEVLLALEVVGGGIVSFFVVFVIMQMGENKACARRPHFYIGTYRVSI